MDPVALVIVVAALLAGLAAGWFLGSRTSQELRTQRDAIDASARELETKLALAEQRAEDVELLKFTLNGIREERDAAQQEIAAYRASAAAREQAHDEQMKQVREMRRQVETEFSVLAEKALTEAQGKFLERANERFTEAGKESTANLKLLLQPVEDSLKKHKDLIDKVEAARTESYGTLTGIIDSVKAGQEAVRNEAAKLVMSLRGNPKTPGRWGEKHFQNLIELAGLAPFVDYEKEKHIETVSGRIRPDYVIRLPGGQSLVVDIKCSVDHYISAVDSTVESDRSSFLESHARSVTTHADALAKKSYTEHLDETPEYVIMYIPGDNFFSAALEADPDLWDRSAKKGVIISCPSTFLPLAHSLSNMWRSHQLERDAAEVAKLGKDLYAKMCTMTDNLRLVGKGIMSAMDNYNNFVGSMEGSVLPQARKFKELSIDTANREIAELTPIDRIAREPAPGRDLLFQAPDLGPAEAAE